MASTSSGPNMDETKVCVIVDSRTPIIIKVPVPPNQIKLADLKSALPAIDQPTYKYFFKSNDSEFGIVKEEIQADDCQLPSYRNRVVAWIVTPDHAGDELASSKNGTFKTISDMAFSETYDTSNCFTPRAPGTATGTTITTSYDDGSSSIMTTDLESTSYFTETEDDSISCSDYSRTTCDTFVSQRRNNNCYSKSALNGKNLPNNNNHRSYYDTTTSAATKTTSRGSPYRGGRGTNGNHHHHHHHDNNHYQNNDSNNGHQRHKLSGNHLENISSSSSTTTTSTSTASSSSNTNSSGSSYSDATAVHCITVHLVLTNENFLGLHIYANSVKGVDEGIYVDGVTENSAVAQDGRIEAGDKLIQVNEVNLEELTNDEAVKVLKEAVIKRGPLKLVVAKFIETNNNNASNKNDPIADLKNDVQPIDTAAWVAHAQAITMPIHTIAANSLNQNQLNPNNCANRSTNSSPSFGSANARDTDFIHRPITKGLQSLGNLGSALRLNRNSNDMREIVQHMQLPKFGVELKDREWLKIQIPRAFLGSDLVAWLERNVCGFSSVREAKKFASKMLKEGYIKDPISKKSFSSKSYYTFDTTNITTTSVPLL